MRHTDYIDVFDRSRWTENDRRYYEIIDEAARGSKNLTLTNGNAKHATYLMAKFLECAKERVRLFSGALICASADRTLVYGNPRIVSPAMAFLTTPGAQFDILLEESIDVPRGEADHPIIAAAKESREAGKLQGRLRVRRISATMREVLTDKFDMHWMTVDDATMRVELDREKHMATANFNNRVWTASLIDLYDTIFNRSGPDVLVVEPETA